MYPLLFRKPEWITDHFPGYVPDELDEYRGAPDAFLCVYGPRWEGREIDYTKVVYPPVLFAVGMEDKALDNLHWVYRDLLSHGIRAGGTYLYRRAPWTGGGICVREL